MQEKSSELHRRSEKPRFHALSGQPGELRLEQARGFLLFCLVPLRVPLRVTIRVIL